MAQITVYAAIVVIGWCALGPILRTVVLALGLLIGVQACAADGGGSLASEYRVLRAQRGHFSGGEWHADVDRFGGRKHEVMIALAKKLGDCTHTLADVVALMGPPDEVFRRGEANFRDTYGGGDARVREIAVYHWRGRHDFLYFTSDGVKVFGADWWFAYE